MNNPSKKKTICFIDPMSYNNLAEYDLRLLSSYKESDCKLFFLGNKKYNLSPITDNDHLIFNYSNYTNKLVKTLSYIFSWFKVLLFLLYHNPDVIHIQWFRLYTFDYFLVRLIKKVIPHSKIIYTAHNVLPHNTNTKYKKIYKKIYLTVDHIITHAEYSKLEIIRDFNVAQSGISVIPHGLLSMKGNKSLVETVKVDFKKKYNIKDKITFLIIGGLSKYKGVDLLIDAWNDEKGRFFEKKDCQLIVAGKREEALVLNIPKNGVLLDKFLPNEEFIALIELADIVVLPYRNISQSGVLLTALEKKKPVWVTNVGGLTDPFKYGDIGWITDYPKVEDLLETLIKIYDLRVKLKDITKNSKLWKDIHENYSWEVISKRTYNLYQVLSQQNRLS